ncbi:MAG TPA: hypothetical protein VFU15_09450 [Bacteroidia bacterium]|nr:hypothetical protein [Bacteroidia bacterium]
MIRLLFLFALLITAACGQPSAHETASTGTKFGVRYTFKKYVNDTPPLSYFVFDITLENNSDSARWFVLPGECGPGDFLSNAPSSVRIGRYCNDSCVYIGQIWHDEESQNCNLILLGPSSKITLLNFDIGDKRGDNDNKPFPLTTLVCRNVSIDSIRFEKFWPVSLLCHGGYDVDFAGSNSLKHLDSRKVSPFAALRFDTLVSLNTTIRP